MEKVFIFNGFNYLFIKPFTIAITHFLIKIPTIRYSSEID